MVEVVAEDQASTQRLSHRGRDGREYLFKIPSRQIILLKNILETHYQNNEFNRSIFQIVTIFFQLLVFLFDFY